MRQQSGEEPELSQRETFVGPSKTLHARLKPDPIRDRFWLLRTWDRQRGGRGVLALRDGREGGGRSQAPGLLNRRRIVPQLEQSHQKANTTLLLRFA
jgi:hypothetical protein